MVSSHNTQIKTVGGIIRAKREYFVLLYRKVTSNIVINQTLLRKVEPNQPKLIESHIIRLSKSLNLDKKAY